ncbi:MAG: hypothetical protein KKG04_01515, partial [Candidatus Thermoplasmatota archaeon]|nr:hypothetical protein [Candidatus Thermoplasmatota archaeon]
VFFILSGCTPISGSITKNITSEKSIANPSTNIDVERAIVSCSSYGIGQKDSEHKIIMKYDDAEMLLNNINNYAALIAQDPQSIEATNLQQEIITLAAEYGLVPKDTLSQINRIQVPRQRLFPNVHLGPKSKADEWFCNYAAA